MRCTSVFASPGIMTLNIYHINTVVALWLAYDSIQHVLIQQIFIAGVPWSSPCPWCWETAGNKIVKKNPCPHGTLFPVLGTQKINKTLYLDHTLLVYSPPPPTGPFAGYLSLFLMKEAAYFIHYVTNTFQVVFSITYNLIHSFFQVHWLLLNSAPISQYFVMTSWSSD